MDALGAIRRRRSVRSYTGEAIPREDIETIVDAGRFAPTGHNRQPWDFIVVTDPETISALSAAATWMRDAGAVIAVVIDPSTSFWLQDSSAAVTSMLIAATALGYGSCWLEGNTQRHEAAFKAQLNVPEDKRLTTLVTLGVPTDWPTRDKRSLADVTHWESYRHSEP